MRFTARLRAATKDRKVTYEAEQDLVKKTRNSTCAAQRRIASDAVALKPHDRKKVPDPLFLLNRVLKPKKAGRKPKKQEK